MSKNFEWDNKLQTKNPKQTNKQSYVESQTKKKNIFRNKIIYSCSGPVLPPDFARLLGEMEYFSGRKRLSLRYEWRSLSIL